MLKYRVESALSPWCRGLIPLYWPLALSLLLTATPLLAGDPGTWAPAPDLSQARAGHTATLLLDGKVLVAGGKDASGQALTSAELFDPATGSSVPVGNLATAVWGHTATLLLDGTVLIAGGKDSSGQPIVSAHLFDPAAAAFTALNMTTARSEHSATRLADGRVLIAGGTDGSNAVGGMEIYDPATRTLSPAPGSLLEPRQSHVATLLADGRVLLAGGSNAPAVLNSVEIFNPADGSIASAGSLTVARTLASAARLLDGTVLVAGGQGPDGQDLASAEIFDPVTKAFALLTAQMSTARSGHIGLILENNGKLILAGGTTAGQLASSVEVYDPVLGTFWPANSPATARQLFGANFFLIPYTGVLFTSGGLDSNNSPLTSSEIFFFPTLRSDKPDYHPGETVTLMGERWLPNEVVSIRIVESNGDPDLTLSQNADGSGAFIVSNVYQMNRADLEQSFIATASGQVSGWTAQTKFTDANNVPAPTSVTTTDQSIGQILLTWINHTGSGAQAYTQIDQLFLSPGGTCPAENPNNPLPNTGYSSLAQVPVSGNGVQDSYLNNIPSQYQIVGEIICYQLYVVKGTPGQTSRASDIVSASAVVDHPPVASNDEYSVNANGALNISAPGLLGNDTDVDAGQTLTAVRLPSDTGPSHGTLNSFGAAGSFIYMPASGYIGDDSFTYHAYDGYAYSVSSATVTIHVSQLTTTTSISAPTITYNANGVVTVTVGSAAGTPTGTVSLTVDSTTASRALNNGSAAFTSADNAALGSPSAGGHLLSASYAAQNGFGASSNTGTLTVNPAPVTATAGSYSGQYDGSAHAPTPGCAVTGTYKGDLTCANSPASVGPDVGSGDVNPVVSGSGQSNFDITLKKGSYSISQASSTTTVTVSNATYDGSPHSGTATVTGAGGLNQSLTVYYVGRNGTLYPSSTTAPTNAGDYTASASFAGDTNHTSSSDSKDFSIAKAPVTATAGSYSGQYDGSAHAPTPACAVTGTYKGDLTCANSPASVGPDVGSGTITPNVSGTGLDNFAITPVNGSWSITQAPSTVTVSCPANVTYNGAAQTPCSAKATGVGMSDVTLTVSYSNNTNKGTATASASWSGDANHTGNTDSKTFTIDPAPVTATAGSYSGQYDGSAHAPTPACAVTGTYKGDLTCANSPASVGPDVGSGDVNPVVSGSGQSNFDITLVPGSYTISKVDATIGVTGYDGPYDGNPHGASGTATGVKGESLNSLLHVASTTYTDVPGGSVSWTFDGNTNYNAASGSAQVKIAKVPSTTTVTGGSFVYDGLAHAATVSVTGAGGLRLTLTPTYSGSCTAAPITVAQGTSCTATATYAGDSNHDGSSGSATVTITPAPVTATAGSYSGTYDGSAHAPTPACAVTGAYTGSLSCANNPASVGPGVGSGDVNADVSGPDKSNFDITLKKGSYSINKATPVITWSNPADIVYGTALSGTQLNATASVPGSFVYTPAAGTVLSAGNNQNLHVDFTPTDTANYNNASKDVTINVRKATTSLFYNGQQIVNIGSILLVGAKLSSAASACVGGQTVTFSLDGSLLGSATTDSSGQATLALATTGWPDGVYTITASFAGSLNCGPSSDSATLTVTSAGSAATGGGWYTLSGSGRVNFGFTVRAVPNTDPPQYKGQFLLINTGKWRLKGTLNDLSHVDINGVASGVGNLYWWDSKLNGGLGGWALSQAGVAFTASFMDSGQGGKNSADQFGIIINYAINSPLEPGTLPNSLPIQLKGGNVSIQQ